MTILYAVWWYTSIVAALCFVSFFIHGTLAYWWPIFRCYFFYQIPFMRLCTLVSRAGPPISGMSASIRSTPGAFLFFGDWIAVLVFSGVGGSASSWVWFAVFCISEYRSPVRLTDLILEVLSVYLYAFFLPSYSHVIFLVSAKVDSWFTPIFNLLISM